MSGQEPQLPAPPPGWQPPAQGWQPPQPQYAGYGYQPYMPPQTEGMAIVALVCAIVSYVICPVVPAIAALLIAPSARRKIEGSGGRLTGLGLITAAKWVAWINIVLVVGLTLLFVVLIAVSGMDIGGTSDFD